MYELIDKELKKYYIDGHKYMFLACLCVSLILGVLSIFYTLTLVLSVIFAIIALIFCISWNSNKKIYGKKLLYTNDTIKIYNYKNIKIDEFKLKTLKKNYLNVAFNYYPKFSFKRCLVLSIDFDPYDNMEYRSFWNNSKIVIIQNSELIVHINKLIDF